MYVCHGVLICYWCIGWHFENLFLFVCLFFVPFENSSVIWRHHNYRWRAANFDLYSALMAIQQWGFFSVPYLLWQVTSACNGHSEDLLHSHLLSRVWQWSCHCLFLRPRSFAAGIRTANHPIKPTVPPPRLDDWLSSTNIELHIIRYNSLIIAHID